MTNQDREIICSVSPGQFDAFKKILINISKNTKLEKFEIQQSKLLQNINRGGSILYVNFHEQLGGHYSFSFVNKGDIVKRLDIFSGNDKTHFVVDKIKKKLYLTNQRYSCDFPLVSNDHKQELKIPELSYVGKNIVFDDLKRIRAKLKGRREAVLSIADDELVEIILHNGVSIILNEILTDIDKKKYRLLSKSFLILDGYEAYMKLAKENQNYWIITQTIMGEKMCAYIFEQFKPKANMIT